MITFEDSFMVKGEKLLCFGDSLTASETGYVKILQDRLANLDIEVINAGRGGDKTNWDMTRLLLTTEGTLLTGKGNQIVAEAMLETWGML